MIKRQRRGKLNPKSTYLSQKEPFGNICGYFSTGYNKNIPKVLDK